MKNRINNVYKALIILTVCEVFMMRYILNGHGKHHHYSHIAIYAILCLALVMLFLVFIVPVFLPRQDASLMDASLKFSIGQNEISKRAKTWIIINKVFAWLEIALILFSLTGYFVLNSFFDMEDNADILGDFYILGVTPIMVYALYVYWTIGGILAYYENPSESFICLNCGHKLEINYHDFPKYLNYPKANNGEPIVDCPNCGKPIALQKFTTEYQWLKSIKRFL